VGCFLLVVECHSLGRVAGVNLVFIVGVGESPSVPDERLAT
jgi:hypothetical protein